MVSWRWMKFAARLHGTKRAQNKAKHNNPETSMLFWGDIPVGPPCLLYLQPALWHWLTGCASQWEKHQLQPRSDPAWKLTSLRHLDVQPSSSVGDKHCCPLKKNGEFQGFNPKCLQHARRCTFNCLKPHGCGVCAFFPRSGTLFDLVSTKSRNPTFALAQDGALQIGLVRPSCGILHRDGGPGGKESETAPAPRLKRYVRTSCR